MIETEVNRLTTHILNWAGELAETWVNTTTGRMLENQKEHVESLLDTNDLSLAQTALLDLKKTCIELERLDNGY